MFEMSHSNQSETIEISIKASFYHAIYDTAKKSKWMRLTGLGIGIVAGVLKIAKQIALIAESIIKGLCNIFGCFFDNKCSLKMGLSQLFIQAPKNVLKLPASVYSAVVSIVIHTIEIGKDPVQFSYEKWCDNDPKEKNKQPTLQFTHYYS